MIDLYRYNPFKGHFLWSTLLLILANLSCLLGIFFFGWTAIDIVWLYWTETLIVGIFNIFKILGAMKGGMLGLFGNIFFAGFFTIHYNIFVLVQGVFIFMFAKGFNQGSGMEDLPSEGAGLDSTAVADSSYLDSITAQVMTDSTAQVSSADVGFHLTDLPGIIPTFADVIIDKQTVYWGIMAIFISHLFSFIYHYIIRGEFRNTTPTDLMVSPYKRIFIQQFVVIGGGFLLMGTDLPSPLLLLLIGLKIFVDLAAHVKEHVKAAMN